MTPMDAFIRGLPKTDLHMHLEGSLEAELLLELADRNRVALPWRSAEQVRQAYEFSNLQSFLDLYYRGCEVLTYKQDFYDLTYAYLRRAGADGVVHAEMFIGPQSFTTRDIPMATIMDGVLAAIDDAAHESTVSAGLIVSAQRHRTVDDALAMLEQLRPWWDRILAIGMGGAEVGNPPSKFVDFFHACRAAGFRTTIHAGEEGPAGYIREAVELLHVDRIDHGIACLDDPDLVRTLVARAIPLTVCPLSNVRLKVIASLDAHPLKELQAAGLRVTINSDDPAYFGGYCTENLIACQATLGLSVDEIVTLVRNGFAAALVPEAERAAAIAKVDAYVRSFDWSQSSDQS